MRKFLLFLLMAVMLIPAALGQMTATIGSTACSPTSYYIPWYHLYDYAETQYGIPASQMAALGASQVTITQLGWYCCGTLPTGNYSLRVYLSQVPSSFDLSTLCSNPINNIANGTLVANNKILTGSGNIKSLVLDTPYTYTPGNHLIVTTCDTLSGWSSSFAWAGNSMAGNGMYRYRDGTVYDCNASTADSTGYCAAQWMTTWFTYTTAGTTHDLTMLAPGGTGAGTVSPAAGTWTYPDNYNAPISATANHGSEFDHWELDGALYSTSASTTVLMDANHTVQAFFRPFTALPLPFTEDFTGVASGQIPVNWDRTHTNWGASASNNAGGLSPEMMFNYSPSGTDMFRLITPRLDGTTASTIVCWFKHYVNHYTTPYTLRVQTSVDGGASWQDRWSMPGAGASGEVWVNLNDVVGDEFLLAFVFDGYSWNINYWYIDDVYVGPSPDFWELDMLNPVGQGAVYPSVGLHDMIMDGADLTLAALPSSTWYAFDLYPNYYNPFAFDPANNGTINHIGTNSTAIFAGTWADDTWYAVSYDPANLYTANPVNGALTLIGSTGQTQISGIAYDEVNDIMYACTGTDLYTMNRSTGALTYIGPFGGSLTVIDMAYGDGVLYAHCVGTDSIYTVNVTTGAATLLGPTGINANYAQGMEYDKDHGRLFLALADFNYAYLAEVDKTDGSIFIWFQFNSTEEVDGFAIPYDIVHPWEFDHWEVDGVFYTNDPVTTLTMHDDHNAQAFFTTSFDTYTLTMLAPGGVGSGAVSPGVGQHDYIENTYAYISVAPDPGSMLDYWQVDGAYFSTNPSDAVLMDGDHTVQAFFGVDTTTSCSPNSLFASLPVAQDVATNSDANYGYMAADDFSGLTDPIGGVDFWGVELNANAGWTVCTKPSLNYNIRFYNPGALPGTLVHQETITVTRTPSTMYLFGDPTYGPLYKYHGTLATPVSLAAGWISIQAVDSGQCAFVWVDAGTAVGAEYAQDEGDGLGYQLQGYGVDLAFCLLGVPSGPEDPTDCEANPEEICVGDSTVLTAVSAYEIHWFDDACGGHEVGVGPALTVNPLVTTTYYARAYDAVSDEWSDGCCEVEVVVHDLPVATASNNSTASAPLAIGDDLELTGGPDAMEDYHWVGPGGWESHDQSPTRPNVDATMAGVYTLTVTDANGCEGIATTTVYIGPPPPIPTMGVTGIGLLLLALGSLMSFARRRK